MQDDLQNNQQEFVQNKKQVEDLEARINQFLEFDLKNMTRFTASNVSQKLDQTLMLADAWLRDLDEKYMRRKTRLSEMLNSDGAKDATWANPGNPFFPIAQESMHIVGDADIIQELLFIFQKALLSFRRQALLILESVRDVEIETIKLEKQNEQLDKVGSLYKEEINSMRADNRQNVDRMMEQTNQLVMGLQECLLIMKQIGDRWGVEMPLNNMGQPKKKEQPPPAPEVSNQEEQLEGVLTEQDQKTMVNMSKSEKIAYLDKHYPKWKRTTIARIVDTDPTYVSSQRNRQV